MKFFLKLLIFVFLSPQLFSYPSYDGLKKHEKESIHLGRKHIIILNCDNKDVFGTYYLGVFNKAKEPKRLKFSILLPKRTVKFEPREGISKEDFILDKKGSLMAEKEFKPGLSLVGIDFKVPYNGFEREALLFELPFDLDEMSLAVPGESGLILQAEGFWAGLPAMLSSSQYSGILKSNLKKGTVFKLHIKGLPRSNFFVWFLALASAFVLLLVLGFYFLKSSKKK